MRLTHTHGSPIPLTHALCLSPMPLTHMVFRKFVPKKKVDGTSVNDYPSLLKVGRWWGLVMSVVG